MAKKKSTKPSGFARGANKAAEKKAARKPTKALRSQDNEGSDPAPASDNDGNVNPFDEL